MLSDVFDITDPQRWPPHLVVPEESDWVFVAGYPKVDVPISGPVRFWVAAKNRSDSDPFVAQHGHSAGLEVRYFLRYENEATGVMLMRRESTLPRYFSPLTETGLADLGRAVAGRPEFLYVDKMIQHRVRLQEQSRLEVGNGFVGPRTVPRLGC
jgi:hypothetical protein